MAGLLQLRDALALYGMADVARLSQGLKLPRPLTQAMLEQLVIMGIAESLNSAPTGGCRSCQRQSDCGQPCYRLCRRT